MENKISALKTAWLRIYYIMMSQFIAFWETNPSCPLEPLITQKSGSRRNNLLRVRAGLSLWVSFLRDIDHRLMVKPNELKKKAEMYFPLPMFLSKKCNIPGLSQSLPLSAPGKWSNLLNI